MLLLEDPRRQRVGDLGKSGAGRRCRRGLHDRRALVTPFPDLCIDRHLAEERRFGELRDLLAPPSAEKLVAHACGVDEVAHVLDDADHRE